MKNIIKVSIVQFRMHSLLLSNLLITVKWQTGIRDRGRLAVRRELGKQIGLDLRAPIFMTL